MAVQRGFRVVAGHALVGTTLAFATGACSSDSTPPPGAPPPVGPGGGTIHAGGGVDIDVPEGAVPVGTEIRAAIVDHAPAPAPAGFKVVGPVLALTPHGTTFSKPITIHMPVPAAGGTVETLSDDADRTWEAVTGLERSSGTATFSVSHISFFAVLANAGEGGVPSSPEASTPRGNEGGTPTPACGHVAPTTTPIFDLIGAKGPYDGPGVATLGGLSADGSTVYGSVADSATARHAIRWTKARGMEALSGAKGPYYGAGITNCDGTVFTASNFESFDGGLPRFPSFRVGPNGAVPTLGLPELPNAGAGAMSWDGKVLVGTCQVEGGGPDGAACVWRGDSATLSTIPGLYQGVPHPVADGNFVWPARGDGYATGVSADGSVIAGSFSEMTDAGKVPHAFRYTEAKGVEIIGWACASTVLLSADGTTLVAQDCPTDSMGRQRHYRWNVSTGRSDPCPGAVCWFSLVSGDGNFLYGYDDNLGANVFWDPKHGVRDARTVLTAAGVNFGQWPYFNLYAMTPDKRVFIGALQDAQLNTQAFRLVLPESAFD